jgi:integrase
VFDATVGEDDLAGAVSTVLARNVRHLDPQAVVFEAMLDGWAMQQRTRFLKASTVSQRMDLVRRFVEFSNQYPWQWQPAEAEAFFDALRSGEHPIAVSTARNYQNVLRMFCDYLTDARYGWVAECLERFGAAPVQVLHEWNTIAHVSEYEGQPGRRPLTYDEVQTLFDAADGRVEEIRVRGRKGALAALRDAALLKTIYGFGLRRQEAVGLDVVDLRSSPKAPRYGQFGALFVRLGQRRTTETANRAHGAGVRLGGRRPRPLSGRGAAGVLSWGSSGVMAYREARADIKARRERGIRHRPHRCRVGTRA